MMQYNRGFVEHLFVKYVDYSFLNMISKNFLISMINTY